MILYTAAQLELVFAETAPVPGCRAAVVDGVPVLVRETGAGRGCIDRVLSTDPLDFLRAGLTPGTQVFLEE